ncbi:PREDICTED: uncharacterized protein LOC104599977 [Nelumbo nucifera]|uniref:Uncharacterized protein LOC104599977 n=1 Tax=Nelumbo nucifera TaxID=4432 RepID=A0A1U8A210_NELNU|nr:PREDICTED: uncharacterized protein LOC104599977 [Nelumbo nucifera]
MTLPKKRLFPLFLLSLFALFLYSYYHSSLHLFSSHSFNSNPTTLFPASLNHLRNSTLVSPNFSFTIKVLAFDRINSLSRCLHSLANADYGDDRVNLHVFIDHFKEIDSGERSADLDKKLDESHRMLNFVDGFSWKFGEKLLHYRTGNVGLQAQWLEAWWPCSDDEFVFVVEDDLEVSPLYYKFLKGIIVNYYYNSSNFSPSIYGASLQRPRFVAGKHGNKLQLDNGTRLFLYQLVGTWGQLLFPKPWKEFRLWYDEHKAKSIKPVLQGMVTTGWYKKMGERIWTPWFIKFIQSRAYFNIYTNFLNERALSVSHRDAGVNYGKTAGPDSYLIEGSSSDLNLLEMQPLSILKWYDFCFREVLPGRVVTNFDELRHVLHTVQKQKSIILVGLFRTPQTIIRNLLCHFERLDIQNYILVGPESEFLHDLARRGNPVISAQKLLNDIRGHKVMDFQGSDAELISEVLVKAYVVKRCLDSSYNSWVINGDMVPLKSDLFSDANEQLYDFSAGRDSDILFVKGSSTASGIWIDDFIYKVAEMANSLRGGGFPSKSHLHFEGIAAKSLEEHGVRIKRLDEMSFAMKVETGNTNQTVAEDRKRIIFWSSEMDLDNIQKRLEDLGMWIVDGDSSCTAVVCHQS